MYTNILFDADDTLLDFQRAQLNGFKEVLANYDVLFSQELYNCYSDINHNLWNMLEAGNITKDLVQSERFSIFFKKIDKIVDGNLVNSIYQKALERQSWLIPYAEDVCKELSKKYTLTIVTNGVGKTQKQRITSSAIFPYITHIIISEDIGVAKPDKRFFDYVFMLTKEIPENMFLIGDSLSSDIEGANNADIDACWYNPHMQPLREDLTIKAMVTDLRQLLSLL